jgi:4-amino-4-deoxy-L-arabinose transferase-like glycosyltransferase
LRLPVALLCALAGCLVFLWAAEVRGWIAGACAAALLASNHLWHVLGGMAMTDGLLAAFFTAAMYWLFADPWLESRPAVWGFAASVAAGILTKSVAGFLPMAVLAAYWVAAPRKYRPRPARAALAVGLAVALAAPWFLYQSVVHRRWFVTEHVGVEILGYGAGAPPQTSAENPALFYLVRAAATDPVLIALALVSVPAAFAALRKRSPETVLLVCWIGVVAAAAFGWQYRNAAYLLPMIPALAILAAAYNPFEATWPLFLPALVAVAFIIKTATPAVPWTLAFGGGSVQPVAPLVSGYCLRGRGNELILVDLDDDLYASTLPLAGLRYAAVGASPPAAGPYAMDFAGMGMVATAAQFNDLPSWMPRFHERLQQWGLDSLEAVATLVEASSAAELAEVVRLHPATDFLIPNRYREALGMAAGTAHELVPAGADHFFLLAREVLPRFASPAWPCDM